jgi:hypothetical protein
MMHGLKSSLAWYFGYNNSGDLKWIGVGLGVGFSFGGPYGWGKTVLGWWEN